ncbi:hypothetical protein [Cohnella sp. JJ-181]|uniref:hypothetical protein n=1 Tax=Cohnella rhizoplanae TaxID=2974897 RepID=UPI0022FF90F5|nr:hypothetical protein [Cohnella sp. JJ-181]CAI6081521.1 hypothetical protein COHCIP112018_03338 [Cohnella sp. JJ-181]
MSGRNNKPENGGPAGHPGRLDQFGDKLGSRNEEEFQAAADAACSTETKGKRRG